MVAEQQAESKVKRVWILGAGFSRPLGGPLLADLFTMRGWRRLRQQFPMNFVSGRPGTSYYADDVGIIRILYAVFHYGTGFPEKALFGVPSRSMGESQFEHAEDFIVQLARMSSQELHELTDAALRAEAFLEYDESGVGSGRHNEMVHPLLSRYPEEKKDALQRDLLAAAKRLMAFECCAFLCELEQSGETEPYLPYKAWANCLSKDDAIITFNYDLVVEKFVDLDTVSVCRMHGGIGRNGHQNAAEWLNKPGNVPDILIPGKEKEGADKGIHQVPYLST